MSFKNLSKHQGLRYLVTGSINTLLALTVYSALLILAGIPVWCANLISISVSTLIGFYLNASVVFCVSIDSLDIYIFTKYMLSFTLQYLLSTLLIYGFIWLGFTPIVSYILMLPIAVLLSFLLQKFWVFKA